MTRDLFFQKIAGFISAVYSLETELSAFSQDPRLTPQQQTLLRILFFSGPQNLSQLSHCMNMNLPNCSREVKKLSLTGFLHKQGSQEDKRIIEISLSPEGKNLIESAMIKMLDRYFQIKPDWTPEKAQKWVDAMDMLKEELF